METKPLFRKKIVIYGQFSEKWNYDLEQTTGNNQVCWVIHVSYTINYKNNKKYLAPITNKSRTSKWKKIHLKNFGNIKEIYSSKNGKVTYE